MIESLDQQNPETAAQIHNVLQAAYRHEAELIGADDFPPLKRSRAHIQQSSTRFLGIWVASDLAAVLEFRTTATVVSIDSLAVDPAYFRRGLARQLLEHLVREEDWNLVEVETASDNEPAISLYHQWGFKESGAWKTGEGILKVRLVLTKDVLDP